MLHGKANMLDYDAICTFVFKDYKDFARFGTFLPSRVEQHDAWEANLTT